MSYRWEIYTTKPLTAPENINKIDLAVVLRIKLILTIPILN